jgi:hypothetical protein
MNAPNTKWSIVSNAPKPAINALKNAGKWQRNNNDHPMPTVALQTKEVDYEQTKNNELFW